MCSLDLPLPSLQIEAFYSVPEGSALPAMLAPHTSYLRESLGRPLLPLARMPRGAVVLAREDTVVGTEEDGTAAAFGEKVWGVWKCGGCRRRWRWRARTRWWERRSGRAGLATGEKV